MAHHEDRRRRPWLEFNIGSGLAKRQYESLRKELHQMSDALTGQIEGLNQEIADVKSTQGLISGAVDSLKANLDSAQAANADLQAQIDTLTADAAVSQSTIESLTAANAAGAAAIGEATASLDSIDEALESVSGEP